MAKSISGLDFDSMDHGSRAVALVGSYLQFWAIMETDVDNTLGQLLGLTGIQQLAVGPNLAFHSKIHVIGALLHLTILPDETASKYRKAIGHMLGYSTDRNVIAHHLFGPSADNDGVAFLATSAKGKITFPDYNWSVAKFEEAFGNLQRCSIIMEEMGQEISKINTSIEELSRALLLPQLPISELDDLTAANPLLHPPQAERTSATTVATPETTPQTPPPHPK